MGIETIDNQKNKMATHANLILNNIDLKVDVPFNLDLISGNAEQIESNCNDINIEDTTDSHTGSIADGIDEQPLNTIMVQTKTKMTYSGSKRKSFSVDSHQNELQIRPHKKQKMNNNVARSSTQSIQIPK